MYLTRGGSPVYMCLCACVCSKSFFLAHTGHACTCLAEWNWEQGSSPASLSIVVMLAEQREWRGSLHTIRPGLGWGEPWDAPSTQTPLPLYKLKTPPQDIRELAKGPIHWAVTCQREALSGKRRVWKTGITVWAGGGRKCQLPNLNPVSSDFPFNEKALEQLEAAVVHLPVLYMISLNLPIIFFLYLILKNTLQTFSALKNLNKISWQSWINYYHT